MPPVVRAMCVASFLALLVPSAADSQSQDDFGVCVASETTDATIEACTRALHTDLNNWMRRSAVALSLRAFAWKAKGDPNQAVADFSEAIRTDPAFAAAYEGRANLFRDHDQCEKAILDYDVVIKLQPEGAENYLSRGLCLVTQADLERAADDFDQVIKLDARNASGYAVVALSTKAHLNLRRGDSDAALANLAEAIALDAKRPDLHIELGAVWTGKGEQEKALAEYDRAIKLDQDNSQGYALAARELKARLYAEQGKFAAGIAEYDEAIKLEPKLMSLYIGRAGIWNLQGDIQRALADYDEAIKIDAAAYSARGNFHRSRADYARALEDYNHAIQKQPNDVTSYSNRALVRFYQGDFTRASDDFKRVVDEQANAYSALMLYVSRVRAGRKDARDELSKNVDKLNKDQWPYPVAELLLGRKQPPAVEAAAKTPEEKCEAQFYIGQWHLTRNAKPAAQKALQTAADNCPKDFVEHRGAIEELKRLK